MILKFVQVGSTQLCGHINFDWVGFVDKNEASVTAVRGLLYNGDVYSGTKVNNTYVKGREKPNP